MEPTVLGCEREIHCLGVDAPSIFERLPRNGMRNSGKGGGWFTWIPHHLNNRGGVLFKVHTDSEIAGGPNVLEFGSPEVMTPDSLAVLHEEYLVPFLRKTRESVTTQLGRPVGFMLGPGIFGRRVASQLNVSVHRRIERRAKRLFYEKLAPLVLTSAIFSPGGLYGGGYCRAQRLFNHVERLFGGDGWPGECPTCAGAPLMYPRLRQHGAGHRAHVGTEYFRTSRALSLAAGSFALAVRTLDADPDAFDLAFIGDPLKAAKHLLRPLDYSARAAMSCGSSMVEMSSIDIQRYYLNRIPEILDGHSALPDWASTLVCRWERALVSQAAGTVCHDSDFSLLKSHLQPMLSDTPIPFGSKRFHAATASIWLLITRGFDPDEVFATRSPSPGTSLLLGSFAHEELHDIYHDALRDALLKMANFVSAPAAEDDPSVTAHRELRLSPRAIKRQELIKMHSDESLSGDWMQVNTPEAVYDLGPPHSNVVATRMRRS